MIAMDGAAAVVGAQHFRLGNKQPAMQQQQAGLGRQRVSCQRVSMKNFIRANAEY